MKLTMSYTALTLAAAGILLLMGCNLRVEKLKTKDINDRYFDFEPGTGSWQDSVFRLCCNGIISTGKTLLDKGRYEIMLVAKGTPAYREYPIIKVMLNSTLLEEVRLDSNFTGYRIPFDLEERKDVRVRFRFDQDGLDAQGNDRDIFIRSVTIHEIPYK